MRPPKITPNELEELLQFRPIAEDEDSAFRTEELAEIIRLSTSHTRALLRVLVKEGRVKPVRKSIKAMDGRNMNVSAYVFVRDGK